MPKPCHGGLLCGACCTVEADSWRRVCGDCFASEIEVPAGRCRLLTQPVGSFSAGRTYYVQWIFGGRIIAENVRPFTLNSGNAVLLIFASDDEASATEAHVPPGVLLPAPAEIRRLRMCNTSKSFCPHVNFVAAPGGPAPTSCRIHLAPRKSTPSALLTPQPSAAVSAVAIAAAAAAAAAGTAVQQQQQQQQPQQQQQQRERREGGRWRRTRRW